MVRATFWWGLQFREKWRDVTRNNLLYPKESWNPQFNRPWMWATLGVITEPDRWNTKRYEGLEAWLSLAASFSSCPASAALLCQWQIILVLLPLEDVLVFEELLCGKPHSKIQREKRRKIACFLKELTLIWIYFAESSCKIWQFQISLCLHHFFCGFKKECQQPASLMPFSGIFHVLT